ncbi:hypothetical protein ACHAXA_001754 [Cyclostephanos tholiformis]|uniref:Uncharacterized protein n=1 Tax=Cyclostephanos tholiformis TaxID=382380 RepID=A0ABD3RGD6_9STRA
MAAGYITPKPTAGELIPMCPPPPALPHKALALTPTSSISRSFDDHDEEACSVLSIGNFLNDGTDRNSSFTRPQPPQRSYDAIRTTPVIWLKPRPSKYTPPSTPVDTCADQSMKRNASSQKIYLMSRNKKLKMTRTLSFSRAA